MAIDKDKAEEGVGDGPSVEGEAQLGEASGEGRAPVEPLLRALGWNIMSTTTDAAAWTWFAASSTLGCAVWTKTCASCITTSTCGRAVSTMTCASFIAASPSASACTGKSVVNLVTSLSMMPGKERPTSSAARPASRPLCSIRAKRSTQHGSSPTPSRWHSSVANEQQLRPMMSYCAPRQFCAISKSKGATCSCCSWVRPK
mmetsp:Transcript_123554/g.308748  ORF Transcript_123554/g.308748 Transcript_123554/m.308748 type:complete len:201 (-) Transcript_123554:596-1198(-)